jgi:hypothetical protein
MIESTQMLGTLLDIVATQWVIEAVLLAILLYLPAKDKMAESNVASLFIFAFVGGIGYRYLLLILQANPDVTLTPIQQWFADNDKVRLFAWYMGLWFVDVIGMLAIYILHQKYRLPNGYLTRTILVAYFVDSLLNVLLFTGRSFWEVKSLMIFYQWIILSINIGIILLAFGMTAKVVYEFYLNKKLDRAGL